MKTKGIYKYSLLLLILLLFTGCQDKLTDLYQNPNSMSKQQADEIASISILAGFFGKQLTEGNFLRSEYGTMYHEVRSGSRRVGTGISTDYLMSEYTGSYSLVTNPDGWGLGGFNHSLFNKVKSPWLKSILWAQQEFNTMSEPKKIDSVYINLLQFLKGFAYQRAIDAYGVIPYVETGGTGEIGGEPVVYKDQKYIYTKILEDLEKIENYLATLNITNAEKQILAVQDILFKGDISLWRKAVNSLRIRVAMRFSEQNPDETSKVLKDIIDNNLPFLDAYDKIFGMDDYSIVDPNLLNGGLGINRAFKERRWEARVPQRFLDVMGVTYTTVNVNGYEYYSADNVNDANLDNGTLDPRLTYLFSPSKSGFYIGVDQTYDNNSNQNSQKNVSLRSAYVADGGGTSGDEFEKLSKYRTLLALYDDMTATGTDQNLTVNYNVRPQWNFKAKAMQMTATETYLYLAEACVRGFIAGDAATYYQTAIEMSIDHWFHLNYDNEFDYSTLPAIPNSIAAVRFNTKPRKIESNYASQAATNFFAKQVNEKLQDIFTQLHIHYNHWNFYEVYTNQRRLIKVLGGAGSKDLAANPAIVFEIMEYKERLSYPTSIANNDPDNWVKISSHDDDRLPVWFTGRNGLGEKWKNVLE